MNAQVEQATEALLERGVRVLNGALLAPTEREHAERLLELMQAPDGARVLDAGCGVGELARLMREKRPDLSFVLLNVSAAQLAHCPQDMERLEGDYHRMPLPDASVDVVLFTFSLCHTWRWEDVLREAVRVLRPQGQVFIFDMARTSGTNALIVPVLDAAAHSPEQVAEVAQRAGLLLEEHALHKPVVERLRETLDPRLHAALDGVAMASTWRLRKGSWASEAESAFARHRRIGFQFSGGRDSTAALYALRPWWDRMTVYHLDTGDQFPETRAVVARVEQDVPIVRISSDVQKVRAEHGLASDVVPVDNTALGRRVSGREVKIISRYDCCYQSLMRPMQERMAADGITLIVRGQRDDEYAAPPLRSGDTDSGFEVLYPIQSWTGEQVSDYLRENELPIAPYYERGARRAPECMGCTAWWDEGRAAYLREYHPVHFERLRQNMRVLRSEINRQMATMEV